MGRKWRGCSSSVLRRVVMGRFTPSVLDETDCLWSRNSRRCYSLSEGPRWRQGPHGTQHYGVTDRRGLRAGTRVGAGKED
ncbi:hypothetical protein E2C01_041798 [Portunus trituberculatus]|uniref:Uncharacterized protein n=1 Tax=Portunus trituberculatus TaxID=210409 RepID=A0A5B7FSN2_PORTR|nr:hypothetical protein [Portunus trituberculatus]